MTTTHTPGPWYVALDSDDDMFVSSDDGKTICEIAHSRDFTDPAKECVANAALISAAPDLLASMEGLLNALHSHTTHPAIIAARAAIAKATKGGTP